MTWWCVEDGLVRWKRKWWFGWYRLSGWAEGQGGVVDWKARLSRCGVGGLRI